MKAPLLFLFVVVLLGAQETAAQQTRTATVPSSITVGDVFQAVVRLDVRAGADVIAPDSLALPEDVELAGRREIRYDTANGTRVATVLYPLTAWRPGKYQLPSIQLRLIGDGSESTVTAALQGFTVTSVLPADTTGIEPKAAKDVLGPNRLWWPLLLLLLLALIAAIAAYVWWRRRRPAVVVPTVPAIAPRIAALSELDALRQAGLLERGEHKLFYERLTTTLRRYAPAVDSAWSTDLTTFELSGVMRTTRPDAVDVLRILGAADLVKFARARTSSDAALKDLDAARAWIERIDPPPVPDSEERKAA